jgi:hypothetical protein
MTKENTGGPAYPTSNYQKMVPLSTGYSEGISIRDYFAAKAMQSYLADRAWQAEIPHSETARVAYIVADAMLKAREA